MDRPVEEKKVETNAVITPETVSEETNPTVTPETVSEETNASQVLDQQEGEAPNPVPERVPSPMDLSPISSEKKTRRAKCPPGCIKKPKCSSKGGKRIKKSKKAKKSRCSKKSRKSKK
jgi:hypothetical protein